MSLVLLACVGVSAFNVRGKKQPALGSSPGSVPQLYGHCISGQMKAAGSGRALEYNRIPENPHQHLNAHRGQKGSDGGRGVPAVLQCNQEAAGAGGHATEEREKKVRH
ncbi:hypothetical protein NDU88_007457 [Pleurodeles waltl]|uniref:Secreted protein n=1 Tax=Pleurodeles waltl TaxID=8319 RepID=A0AAV7N6E3_PLEWA|nr:hypothetical protein NDU88_007457 [Pleurodeles waltl]